MFDFRRRMHGSGAAISRIVGKKAAGYAVTNSFFDGIAYSTASGSFCCKGRRHDLRKKRRNLGEMGDDDIDDAQQIDDSHEWNHKGSRLCNPFDSAQHNEGSQEGDANTKDPGRKRINHGHS